MPIPVEVIVPITERCTSEDEKPYTLYVIDVRVGRAPRRRLRRRYNDLFEFNKKMRELFPSVEFPAFPAKKLPCLSMKRSVVTHRRELIEDYFNTLLANESILNSQPFKDFLDYGNVDVYEDITQSPMMKSEAERIAVSAIEASHRRMLEHEGIARVAVPSSPPRRRRSTLTRPLLSDTDPVDAHASRDEPPSPFGSPAREPAPLAGGAALRPRTPSPEPVAPPRIMTPSLPPKPSEVAWEAMKTVLMTGGVFLKHVKRGAPHQRKFWVTDKLDMIAWGDIYKRASVKCIKLDDVVQIMSGLRTPNFWRSGDPEHEGECFSIITEHRTLDVQVNTRDERDMWVRALKELLARRQGRELFEAHLGRTVALNADNLSSSDSEEESDGSDSDGEEAVRRRIKRRQRREAARAERRQRFEEQLVRRLEEGCVFVKHTKGKAPHLRKVWINHERTEVLWRDLNTHAHKSIAVAAMIEIKLGHSTETFKANKKKRQKRHTRVALEEHCFSIVAKERTLDLEADSEQQRNFWVQQLERLIFGH